MNRTPWRSATYCSKRTLLPCRSNSPTTMLSCVTPQAPRLQCTNSVSGLKVCTVQWCCIPIVRYCSRWFYNDVMLFIIPFDHNIQLLVTCVLCVIFWFYDQFSEKHFQPQSREVCHCWPDHHFVVFDGHRWPDRRFVVLDGHLAGHKYTKRDRQRQRETHTGTEIYIARKRGGVPCGATYPNSVMPWHNLPVLAQGHTSQCVKLTDNTSFHVVL